MYFIDLDFTANNTSGCTVTMQRTPGMFLQVRIFCIIQSSNKFLYSCGSHRGQKLELGPHIKPSFCSVDLNSKTLAKWIVLLSICSAHDYSRLLAALKSVLTNSAQDL